MVGLICLQYAKRGTINLGCIWSATGLLWKVVHWHVVHFLLWANMAQHLANGVAQPFCATCVNVQVYFSQATLKTYE